MKTNRKLGPVVQRCFLGLIALIVINAVLALWAISSMKSTAALVEHTHTVLLDMEQLEGACGEMENGMLGYVLTGQEVFLEPYARGQQLVKDESASLKDLLHGNPAQLQRLKEMEEIILSKIDEAPEILYKGLNNSFRLSLCLLMEGC